MRILSCILYWGFGSIEAWKFISMEVLVAWSIGSYLHDIECMSNPHAARIWELDMDLLNLSRAHTGIFQENKGNGPPVRYLKLRVKHALGMPGTSGFLWSRWRGKRSRHSRRMRNPQFYVSGKRPIARLLMLSIRMTSGHQKPWFWLAG